MGEYIEREQVIALFDESKWQGQICIDAVKEIQAVDVAPVVHGRWIRYPDCGVTRCSNCDWNIEECFASNYCPNCGAKMDQG